MIEIKNEEKLIVTMTLNQGELITLFHALQNYPSPTGKKLTEELIAAQNGVNLLNPQYEGFIIKPVYDQSLKVKKEC